MSSADDGFTLIELLIAIVVLGILAAVTVFALSGITAKSAAAACNANAKTVDIAVAAYNAQTGGNPTVTASLLTTGPNAYLQSFPASSNYTISIVSGVVMVAAPASAVPVAYDTTNTCGSAGQSSSTTTSTTVANGVTATPSVPSNSNPYGAQEELSLTNTSSITALQITITVAATTGVSESQQNNSFPSGATVTNTNSTTNGVITYNYVLTGSAIPAGYNGGNAYAQFAGTGTPHATSGDTWTVTTTSGGITSTLSGHF